MIAEKDITAVILPRENAPLIGSKEITLLGWKEEVAEITRKKFQEDNLNKVFLGNLISIRVTRNSFE